MKIALIFFGSLSLVARVCSSQQTIQNGIYHVNKYISGETTDLRGILYFLRHHALISYNDHNVYTGSLNNQVRPLDVANAILNHLQIDQAIQDIKNYQSRNNGNFNALKDLLNKDLFKQVLLNHHEHQALINALNNQVAPEDVASVILKKLHIEQGILALKNYQSGNNGNQHTLLNILNNRLVNKGLISHDDYDRFKRQLNVGGNPNAVANAVVGFLHNRKDVQILLHNVPYDKAIQVLKNYRAANTRDPNELFNILHNDFLTSKGLITSQEYSGFKDSFGVSPINGDPNLLAIEVIKVLNSKRQVQSD